MSSLGISEAPVPTFSSSEIGAEQTGLLNRFQAATTKIAIQRDGALTDVARTILWDTYGICVPEAPKGRVPVSVSEDGETSFIYARNKSICQLVAEKAVTMAIVGTDRLIEDEVEDKVDILASYRDRYSWSLVLATPADSPIKSLGSISRVATQYPIIASRYFKSQDREDIDVVPTTGGTELYPYLQYGEQPIDAVIDLMSTGETLEAHNMTPWTPGIGTIYPVLIAAKSLANRSLKNA